MAAKTISQPTVAARWLTSPELAQDSSKLDDPGDRRDLGRNPRRSSCGRSSVPPPASAELSALRPNRRRVHVRETRPASRFPVHESVPRRSRGRPAAFIEPDPESLSLGGLEPDAYGQPCLTLRLMDGSSRGCNHCSSVVGPKRGVTLVASLRGPLGAPKLTEVSKCPERLSC
jgi:hypothetical protein